MIIGEIYVNMIRIVVWGIGKWSVNSGNCGDDFGNECGRNFEGAYDHLENEGCWENTGQRGGDLEGSWSEGWEGWLLITRGGDWEDDWEDDSQIKRRGEWEDDPVDDCGGEWESACSDDRTDSPGIDMEEGWEDDSENNKGHDWVDECGGNWEGACTDDSKMKWREDILDAAGTNDSPDGPGSEGGWEDDSEKTRGCDWVDDWSVDCKCACVEDWGE